MNEQEIIKMANPVLNAGDPSDGAVSRDEVVLYAEHRSVVPVLGEYGGDSYPAAYRKKGADGKEYGILAVADGVGSGGFIHKSLINYLSDEPTEKGRLKKFLTSIFGEEFLKDGEAVLYAVKNFAPLPPNGFYSSATKKAQIDAPFYARASQYLASRIACIAAFYKFRDFFADKDITPRTAAMLRKEMVEYYDGVSDENGELLTEGELRKNLKKIFDISDGVQPKDRDHYYLPTTFSCWFYKDDGDKIKAVSVNIGDSRCYKVDGVDGVLQISVDDANPVDNSLTRMIRYGTGRHVTADGAHDCLFNVVTAEIEKPCALFCCTDGVYDTCQNVKGANYKEGLPFNSASPFTEYDGVVESCDAAFEYNYFNMLRSCKSVEDVRQFTARAIYLHRDPEKLAKNGAIGEYTEAGEFGVIKQDDSATMAMRFFSKGEGYPEILSALSDEKNANKTSLIKLFDKLKEKNAAGDRYCYKGPAADKDPSAIKEKRLVEYTTREPLQGKLIELIGEDSKKAVESGKMKMWGAPCAQEIRGFSAKRYFVGNSLDIFKVLTEDMKVLDALDKSNIIPPEAAAKINEKYAIWFGDCDKIQTLEEKLFSVDQELQREKTISEVIKGPRATGSKQDLYAKKGAVLANLDDVFSRLNKSKNFFSKDFPSFIKEEKEKTLIDRSDYSSKCVDLADDVCDLCSLFETFYNDYVEMTEKYQSFVEEIGESLANLKKESNLLKEELKALKEKSAGSEAEVTAAVAALDNADLIARWKRIATTKGELPAVLIDASASGGFIPDGWFVDEHVVYTIDRYLAIDKIVKESLGAQSFTAYRAAVDKEIGDAAGGEYFEKAKRSYEEFSALSTAVFEEASGDDRFAVKIARERGIIRRGEKRT